VFAYLVVCRCDMVDNDEDCGRSRRPVAEDQGWSSTGRVLGGLVIRRSGDAVFCTIHTEMRSMSFLIESQNQGQQVSWLSLKTKSDGFLRFDLKTGGDGFLRSGLKTGGDGFSWFGLKTGGSCFPVWA
jgi:hypothetical protein